MFRLVCLNNVIKRDIYSFHNQVITLHTWAGTTPKRARVGRGKMRGNKPITTVTRKGVACNAPNTPNTVTPMVGWHTPARRGRPACLPLCNDVCPMCNDVYPICGVSLRRGVAGNAPTLCCEHGTVVRRHGLGQTSPQTGRHHGEQGRHAGLPLQQQHPQPTAKYGEIYNFNSTTTAQGDRRPYGTTTTTGDIT
jgi:hypothetical protein